MAKVLTEQARIWSPSSGDPVQFGDGAPLHSAILLDLVRMANNMQTYCSPHMQFFSDICPGTGHTVSRPPRCMINRTATNGSAAGTGLLAQCPILVPVDAVRLNWSIGIYRDPAAAEAPISVNVGLITLYLAAGPCISLTDPVPSNPAPSESTRLFDPSSISGPYTSNTYDLNLTDSTTRYKIAANSNWTDYAPRGLNNLNDRNGDANAILIVTAAFDSMAIGEAIRMAETSIWFGYE